MDLRGGRYLVTGATAGLGAETARVLVLRGAHVVATGRTLDSASAACASLGPLALPMACELSEPSSVRALVSILVERGDRFDGIICNAGIMALPELATKYDIELQFLTNHLGHFLLVTGLLPLLEPTGRIVVLSSDAHRASPRGGIDFDNLDGRRGYRPWMFYGQSKVANLVFAKALAKRLPPGQTANAVHPGVIMTSLQRSLPRLFSGGMALIAPVFFKSIQEGAATSVYAATHPALAGTSGEYLSDCNVARPRKVAEDAALAERLWTFSERFAARFT